MEPIIFTTFVTDNEWREKCAVPLENSLRYFHPEIPFKTFSLDALRELYPSISIGNAKAFIGKTLSEQFSLVVILDSDSIITAPLEEVLANDYEVAGVRNRSDHGSVHMETALDLFQVVGSVDKAHYLNAGLVACRAKKFFDDWAELNKTIHRFDLDQGTLNIAAYTKGYKTKMLDPPEAPYYYGVANSFGDKTAWDSWRTIRLEDNRLFMKNKDGQKKQVKILHRAGSGRTAPPGEKFPEAFFDKSVYQYLCMITK